MIFTDELRDYLALVANVRLMQAQYRKTICSQLRHQLPPLERQLDAATLRLTAKLDQWCAEAREAALAVEGGVA